MSDGSSHITCVDEETFNRIKGEISDVLTHINKIVTQRNGSDSDPKLQQIQDLLIGVISNATRFMFYDKQRPNRITLVNPGRLLTESPYSFESCCGAYSNKFDQPIDFYPLFSLKDVDGSTVFCIRSDTNMVDMMNYIILTQCNPNTLWHSRNIRAGYKTLNDSNENPVI